MQFTLEKNESLKICIKTIVICYVPNAIPVDRIIKLVGYIVGPEYETYLSDYGVKKFIQDHLPEDASVLDSGAVVHAKCKDG